MEIKGSPEEIVKLIEGISKKIESQNRDVSISRNSSYGISPSSCVTKDNPCYTVC